MTHARQIAGSHRHRVARRAAAHAAAVLLMLVAPVVAAEKFVYFGEQPDGTEIFVQAAPAAVRKDGKLQGWFRTVAKKPGTVTDESGTARSYHELIALNVADCSARRIGAASMTYRDDKGATVATFAAAPQPIEFREVRKGTAAESMFTWLCAPKPRSAGPAPSAAGQTPFK